MPARGDPVSTVAFATNTEARDWVISLASARTASAAKPAKLKPISARSYIPVKMADPVSAPTMPTSATAPSATEEPTANEVTLQIR